MAKGRLESIGDSLKLTLADTEALYRSIHNGSGMSNKRAPVSAKPNVRFGLTEDDTGRWMPPYTESQAPLATGYRKDSHVPNPGKTVKFAKKPEKRVTYSPRKEPWKQNAEYVTRATNSDFFRSLNVDLEGWTESQRQVFYKIVSSAEKHMHAESERLQREYSQQLEKKLAFMRREMAEAHRSASTEFSELRMEHERLSFDDSENRRALRLTKDSLQNLQKAYDNLMDECGVKSGEIVRLNSLVANTERSFMNLKQRTLQLENELNNKSQQLEALHGDISNIYKQMETTSSNNTKTERKLTAATNELKTTQTELGQVKLEMEALLLGNQSVIREKETLENRIRSLEKEVSELTSEKLRLSALVQTLEEETIASLKRQRKVVEDQLNEARMELVSCDKRQEVSKLKRELESVQYQCNLFQEDNRSLLKENGALTRQVQQLQTKMKDSENDLFQLKCKIHLMRQNGCKLPKPQTAHKPSQEDAQSPVGMQESKKPEKPYRRDIFAPTMFDAPAPEDQKKIDELEKMLTELCLEKDEMESEMTRCHIGPKSPAADRRRHHLLEIGLEKTKRKIQEVTDSIRKLQVPI